MNMLRSLYGKGTVLGMGVLFAAVATSVSGQSQAPVDPVVAEIRALRVDLNQRLDASIRAQLMVSRLSLQEQRMQTVIRQLSDVQTKLKESETSRAQLENGLKMLGFDKLTDKEKQDISPIFGSFISGRDTLDKMDADLKLQLSDLTTLLNQEQARWNSFNRMLDEIEAALSKPVK